MFVIIEHHAGYNKSDKSQMCWQVEKLEILQPCLSMLFDGFHVEH
jgi:hypothetical protein